MLTYSEESLNNKPSPEELKKQERMRDVTLLLQQLVEREEIALKLIIDCLIDVGSINYANNKVHNPPLNKIMKILVGYAKPAARKVALYWVKRNLPGLVANWLERKVSFASTPSSQPVNEPEEQDLESLPAADVAN